MKRQFRDIITRVDRLSIWAIAISGIAIFIIMVVEVLNALGRKFAMPLPCTLEMAESLMIVCIFLAAPRVASLEQHTYVTLMTRKLPGSLRRSMDALGNFIGGLIIGIIAYGSWEMAYSSIIRLEMRIGVFRFPIWPFRIIFAVGITLLALQFVSNGLRCLIDIKDRRYTVD
jgi:TRAP-type C4-dicarboxylate transport system permease small subunit